MHVSFVVSALILAALLIIDPRTSPPNLAPGTFVPLRVDPAQRTHSHRPLTLRFLVLLRRRPARTGLGHIDLWNLRLWEGYLSGRAVRWWGCPGRTVRCLRERLLE